MVILQPSTAEFAALSVPSARDAARIETDGGGHDLTINKQRTAEKCLFCRHACPERHPTAHNAVPQHITGIIAFTYSDAPRWFFTAVYRPTARVVRCRGSGLPWHRPAKAMLKSPTRQRDNV